jgi:DNA-binding NarL/FixJ family response regulator
VGRSLDAGIRPIRLLVVDDHEVVREGLVAALSGPGPFDVVEAVGSAAEALAVLRRASPDVAVVDLRLPDASGAELCRAIRVRRPGTPVVILSSYSSEDSVRAAMQAGAAAYISKSDGLVTLREVLERVVADELDATGPQIVEQLHRLLVRRDDHTRPTPHQVRVLDLAADGLTNNEIGERLFISESTVRFHMQKLKTTFGARTKTDLIAKAIRAGVITPGTEEFRPCR